MKDRTGEWIREQIKSFRVTWNRAPALPLSEWLTAEMVARILEEVKFAGRDRVYTPLATLWVFLSQVLSVDHSCREAVARLMTHRQSCGAGPGSPDASPYCQARQKLPEELFSRLVRGTGQTLHDSVPQACGFTGSSRRSWTVQPSRCRTHRPTNASIRRRAHRSRDWAFRSRGWWR